MQESIFVRDLAIVLIAATVAGWAVQRAGLSAVVGYLLAGIAIGPFSPVVKVVSNIGNIQLLAQMGLVFLMFAIGLGLSLARLQRMGVSIVVAVVISSILIFNVCRWFGSLMDWRPIEILFLAGTLMISSSAIIIKVLDELNITHQRAGQLALGITVLEDIVSVVMLTLFISAGAAGSAPLGSTLGTLAAFVVLLAVIAMLAVPRILKMLSRDASPELRVIAVTGLVLGAAIWALEAGYSLALGAFVLGVVVAGTRYKDEMEGAFAALHTIFGAVFFVAVGMLFDYRLLADVWALAAAVTALTLFARPLACAFGLMAVGHSGANALKAGIALIPVGEFAFVLIQVGRSSNALSEKFYALGVGVSLATAVIGPLVTRRADAIVSGLQRREPRVLREMVGFYHRWLERLQARGKASAVWSLCSGRVFQSGFHLLLISAIILFSKPVHDYALAHIAPSFPFGFGVIFWSVFGLALLAPLIVLWRNLEALAMIVAEGATVGAPQRELLRKAVEVILKGIAGVALIGWLLLLIPVGRLAVWALVVAGIAILIWAPVFWRRLVNLHSKIEVDLRARMKAASTLGSSSGLPGAVVERPQEWNLQVDEVTIPSGSEHVGRRIAELAIRQSCGCSIMAIDRQGFLIANPGADDRVFAGDKLLLVGAVEQLAKAEQVLRGAATVPVSDEFEYFTMETVEAPNEGAVVGKTLAELNLPARFGIQICGIERRGERLVAPASESKVQGQDKLLVLGPHDGIQGFRNEITNETVVDTSS